MACSLPCDAASSRTWLESQSQRDTFTITERVSKRRICLRNILCLLRLFCYIKYVYMLYKKQKHSIDIFLGSVVRNSVTWELFSITISLISLFILLLFQFFVQIYNKIENNFCEKKKMFGLIIRIGWGLYLPARCCCGI